MTSAERSRRYRERQKALLRDAAFVTKRSPVAPVTVRVADLLTELLDVVESVTPAELVEQMEPIEALGVGGDARIASAWLGAVDVLAAGRAR